MQELRVLRGWDEPESWTLERYRAHGGYEALATALGAWTPEQVVDEVYWSGLRGRGGAGFSTGSKWRFLPKPDGGPRYLVINADEGEPGTFKDRAILETVPHRVVEGILLACYAIQAERAYFYIRGELALARERMRAAVEEARAAGLLRTEIVIHVGAGAYICGEETSLLESLEGRRAEPKLKPPFPAVKGLYERPTIVNNVETLANVPLIVSEGAAAYRAVGSLNPAVDAVGRGAGPPPGFGPDSAGTRVHSVSGAVVRPGVYEIPMGYPLSRLIAEECGGILPGRAMKAVIPGGSSAPMLGAEHFDVPMDFQSVANAGSMLGSGAVIVIDDRTCIVKCVENLVSFYHHESCGKCTPCREGSGWILRVIARIEAGRGTAGDLEMVKRLSSGIKGKCFCPLGESIPAPVDSSLALFPEEWRYHVEHGCCMVGSEATSVA